MQLKKSKIKNLSSNILKKKTLNFSLWEWKSNEIEGGRKILLGDPIGSVVVML